MAHIDTLQSGAFTSLAIAAAPLSTQTEADLVSAFQSVEPSVINGITEFPEFETESGEILNVPEYGAGESSQLGVQAERQLLEFSVLFSEELAQVVGLKAMNGQTYAFQIALADRQPSSHLQVAGVGIGAMGNNTVFNFAGQVAGFSFDPTLDAAIIASVTIAVMSDLHGPFTYGGPVDANALTNSSGDQLTDSLGNPVWI